MPLRLAAGARAATCRAARASHPRRWARTATEIGLHGVLAVAERRSQRHLLRADASDGVPTRSDDAVALGCAPRAQTCAP
eukprot:1045831-Pyramimonas_sp.AAC.1